MSPSENISSEYAEQTLLSLMSEFGWIHKKVYFKLRPLILCQKTWNIYAALCFMLLLALLSFSSLKKNFPVCLRCYCCFWNLKWCNICNFLRVSFLSSFCPSKQRKESETQCQTDSKFDLEVVESKEPVAMETRSSEYVSRYIINTLWSCGVIWFLSWLRRTSCNTVTVWGVVKLTLECTCESHCFKV